MDQQDGIRKTLAWKRFFDVIVPTAIVAAIVSSALLLNNISGHSSSEAAAGAGIIGLALTVVVYGIQIFAVARTLNQYVQDAAGAAQRATIYAAVTAGMISVILAFPSTVVVIFIALLWTVLVIRDMVDFMHGVLDVKDQWAFRMLLPAFSILGSFAAHIYWKSLLAGFIVLVIVMAVQVRLSMRRWQSIHRKIHRGAMFA